MTLDQSLNKILIIDFGSQFTQLIARRVRELGIFSENEKEIKIIEWPDLIKTPLLNKLEIYLEYGEKNKERKMKINGVNKWKDFENEI